MRAEETVFFKHKCLTQPTITTSNVLIKAADGLSQAIQGTMPKKGATMEAVEQLLDIFKQQAKEKEDTTAHQRVLKESAQTQRVQLETEQEQQQVEMQPTSMPNEHPTIDNTILMVSQDEEEEDEEVAGPSVKTRARTTTRTVTQEVLLQMADVSSSGIAVMPRSAASRKSPMQFLCDYANVVLDGKTGELLEYRHLMACPKYKQAWGASFGNEIGRLAQGMPYRVEGTDTFCFVNKN